MPALNLPHPTPVSRKRLLRHCWLAVWLLSGSAFVQAATLEVVFSGLSSDKGVARMALFNSAEGFKARQVPYRELSVSISAGTAHGSFEELAPGSYVVRVYQDQNRNDRLDRSAIGIPSEPFGFSNNPQLMGPPQWSQLAFELGSAGRRIDVHALKVIGSVNLGAGYLYTSGLYYGKGERRLIPFISYIGDRLKLFGPFVSYRLWRAGATSVNLRGRLSFGGFKTADDPYYRGMDEPEIGFDLGLAFKWKMTPRSEISLAAQNDVTNRHGGGSAELDLSYRHPVGPGWLTSAVAAHWYSRAQTHYYYGVDPHEVRPDRPLYQPGTAQALSASLGVLTPIGADWTLFINIRRSWFNAEVTDSPLVRSDHSDSVITAVSYGF